MGVAKAASANRSALLEGELGSRVEHLFQGSALNAVDAKGRVSLPAFLRQVVEKRGDAHAVVLAKHDTFPCITAYDRGYAAIQHRKLERIGEALETDPARAAEYHARNLLAFGTTEDVPYDPSGRIVLPPMSRRKAKIADLALFIGAGETFQIWNPAEFLAHEAIHEDLKDVARYRLEEKGIAL